MLHQDAAAPETIQTRPPDPGMCNGEELGLGSSMISSICIYVCIYIYMGNITMSYMMLLDVTRTYLFLMAGMSNGF